MRATASGSKPSLALDVMGTEGGVEDGDQSETNVPKKTSAIKRTLLPHQTQTTGAQQNPVLVQQGVNDDLMDTESMEALRQQSLAVRRGQPGPPPTPEVRIASRWLLDKKIGSGAFGDIYIGISLYCCP